MKLPIKKFLFTTLFSNDLGLLTRSLPVARELAKRGHKIAFCNPADAPNKLITEAGFENLLPRHPLFYLKMTGELDFQGLYRITQSGQLKRDFGNLPNFLIKYIRAAPLRLTPGTTEIWNMDHFAALLGMMNKNFVRAICDTLVALIKDYETDVVVDAWNPWACIAARAAQKPLVSIIQADMHPASRGFIWWKEPPPNIPTPVPAVNRVLAGYSLPPIRKMAELHAGDLTLVLGTPESDPLPADAGVAYIGPILWQAATAEMPAWSTELSNGKPVIWVYSGNPSYGPKATWADSAIVLHTCIAALGGEDVQVVLSTGHHPLPNGVLPLPENFRYESFVPGLAMAQMSDLLIHHGGYGSCQTGLYTGTPALIIPTYSERESNARRVAALGAGDFVVPPEGASGNEPELVEEMRMKVRRILSDPSFTQNAQRIGEKMQTYGGTEEAARLIEAFSQS